MSHIEWPTAFDRPKSQVQQFTHGSTDDNHHRLTLVEQVFAERLNHRIEAPSVNCGQVKYLTQVATADLGQSPTTFSRGDRLVVSRWQAHESSQLSGTSEVGKSDLSQQLLSRGATNSWDALEQRSLSLKRRMLVNVVVDGRLDRGDLLVEVGDHRLERILNSAVQRGFEPVLLLLSKVFEVLEPPNQRLELFNLRSKRQPRVRPLLETKVGDDKGVLFVSLVTAQAAFGVVLDASGIDHADSKAFSHKILGERHTITAGGLQAGVEFFHALFS